MTFDDRWQQMLALLSAEPSSDYRYPDPESELERGFAGAKPEEREALSGFLEQAVPASRRSQALGLEVGCGQGTYTALLAGLVSRVVAIDPDAARLAVAEGQGASQTTRFFALELGATAFEAPALRNAFQVVQCVQVLGHVPVEVAAEMVRRIEGLLDPAGSLVLALPYVNGPMDEFWIAGRDEQGAHDKLRVSREEFDELAANPRDGVLPVRHFSMPSIDRLLGSARLRANGHRPYNWFSDELADIVVLACRA